MLYLITDDKACAVLIQHVSDSLEKLYRPLGSVSITHNYIDLENVRWGTRVLSNLRLCYAHRILNGIEDMNVKPFPFLFYVAPEGSCQIISPPIVEAFRVERDHDGFLLLDGSHRCYAAMPFTQSVRALVITFTSQPKRLPCTPLTASCIEVRDTQPRLKELFVDLSEPNFRPVRQLTHGGLKFLSLNHAIEEVGIRASSLALCGRDQFDSL